MGHKYHRLAKLLISIQRREYNPINYPSLPFQVLPTYKNTIPIQNKQLKWENLNIYSVKEGTAYDDGRLGGRTEMWTGMGRPVPVPPQLLQAMRPDPEQLRQPRSPSDQREQRQETRPEPLQLWHLGPIMVGFWSINDLTRTAPANTLRPVASWVNTIGPLCSISLINKTVFFPVGEDVDDTRSEREKSERCEMSRLILLSCKRVFVWVAEKELKWLWFVRVGETTVGGFRFSSGFGR